MISRKLNCTTAAGVVACAAVWTPDDGAVAQAQCGRGRLIESVIDVPAAVDGCNVGDRVWVQFDRKQVAYSLFVAQFCNLRSTIVVEVSLDGGITHVVCEFTPTSNAWDFYR